MSNSKPNPVDDLSHRVLKRIGVVDPRLCESNNAKEIEIMSWKKQRSEKWKAYLDSNTNHLRIQTR